MQAMPGHASPSFPNTGQAVVLSIGVLMMQVAGAGFLAILSEITGAPAGVASLPDATPPLLAEVIAPGFVSEPVVTPPAASLASRPD